MSHVREPRVAYQGEPGAYSEEAVLSWSAGAAHPDPCPDFRTVAARVTGGQADYGLLPVENSLAGSVAPALDALLESGLQPVAEVVRPIRHCLLAKPGARVEDLRQVISHPVALAQCLTFFRDRPWLQAVAVHDTAGAARLVGEDADPGLAAVASEGAALRYGLEILERDLQDRDDNQTRFLVVARAPEPPEADAAVKTLVIFETEHRPGALVEALLAFSSRGLDLTRLESRPGPAPWTYRFVAEVAGDLRGGRAAEAVEEARRRTLSLVVRGPFRRAAASVPGAGEPQLGPAGRTPGPGTADSLEAARRSIDALDDQLIRLLSDRLTLARRAQSLRSPAGRAGIDPGREARVVRQAVEAARTAGLPEEEARRVIWSVLALCAPVEDRPPRGG